MQGGYRRGVPRGAGATADTLAGKAVRAFIVNPVLGLAGALSFVAGFALHRGGICAGRAVHDVVEKAYWARFLAFVECAAWALIVLLLAEAAGHPAPAAWPGTGSIFVAAAGGALFGLGALVNGTCAFGSAGRLAGGEVSFVLLVPGFVLGALAALQLGVAASLQELPMSHASGLVWVVLVAALALFAVWRISTAWRSAPAFGRMFAQLSAPQWPPALAMAVIAFSNVGLMLIVVAWPYTTLLLDVAVGRGMEIPLRVALALVFLAGAIAGAVSAGRFRVRGASIGELGVRLGGGFVMGFGASMIPGGNDPLVLLGLPLLQPTAIAAYAAMIAVIATGFGVQKLVRRRHDARTYVP